jgi:hypothetical protein
MNVLPQNYIQGKNLLRLFFFFSVHISYIKAVVVKQPVQVPYVSPADFCKKLPSGNFCNANFPRSFLTCPTGIQNYCPEHYVCSHGTKYGEIKCVPNLWDPVAQVCEGRENFTSYCLSNTVVECTQGEQFFCPSDTICKRRGRRSYCIQPVYAKNEPTHGFCSGYKGPGSVCHPVNLKKIYSCPNETLSFCPKGHMCGIDPADKVTKCIKYEKDVARFCHNKPIFSSFCIIGSKKGDLIMCSQHPQIMSCNGGCYNNNSLTSSCVRRY